MRATIDDLEQAVKADPSFEQAWIVLGGFEFQNNQNREAMYSIRKALALKPANTQPYKMVAAELTAPRRYQEAMDIWGELAKQHPEDADVHTNLASLLLNQKRYQEAVDQLEAAVNKDPTRPDLQAQLGHAYVQVKNLDKAMAAFSQAFASKKDPVALNDAAYDLAENDFHLDQAERWAEEAVERKEAESASITTDALSVPDLYVMNALSAFWDTLGWIHFREGHLAKAESYLGAAWKLSQDALVGEHLAAVYEKEGKKAESARVLALSKAAAEVASPTPNPELRRRDGSFAVPASRMGTTNATGDLSQMRRVKLGKLYPKSGAAEFWLLFANGPKLEQIKFISGDEDIKALGGALQSAKFNVLFPDDHPTKILRRGVLVCESMGLGCDFTVYVPGTVTSTE